MFQAAWFLIAKFDSCSLMSIVTAHFTGRPKILLSKILIRLLLWFIHYKFFNSNAGYNTQSVVKAELPFNVIIVEERRRFKRLWRMWNLKLAFYLNFWFLLFLIQNFWLFHYMTWLEAATWESNNLLLLISLMRRGVTHAWRYFQWATRKIIPLKVWCCC